MLRDDNAVWRRQGEQVEYRKYLREGPVHIMVRMQDKVEASDRFLAQPEIQWPLTAVG